MATPLTLLLLASFLMAFLPCQCVTAEHSEQAESGRVYIAFLGERKHDDPELVRKSHHDMLTSLLGSKEKALKSIIYSYKHGFSGFAATLTESQAKQLSGFPGVISVKPNQKRQLQTTRSWDFLGLPYDHPEQGTLLQKANYGENVIIGVVDTGLWPESRSFRDEGFGPIPSRWKGKCQTGQQFNKNHCNKKLIGVRWYSRGVDKDALQGEYLSARDLNGHGTHTSSTAAGVLVPNVSFNGIAAGAARGGAPRARLAMYKVCWGVGGACFDAPILKAIDDAIHDGVDVLSLSLGSFVNEQMGTLFAVSKGMTIVYAAGNDGPAPQTVSASVPWIISVAASTLDRSFPTVLNFDNNLKLVSQGLFYDNKKSSSKPIVAGGRCDQEALKNVDVTGKIVLCFSPGEVTSILPRADFGIAMSTAVAAGAGGVIYVEYPIDLLYGVTDICNGIPCVFVDIEAGLKIFDIPANSTVKVSLTRTVEGDEVWAPVVAAFSSRGPSHAFPSVIKPDVAAPGSNILAAKRDSYAFDSGTSMACPHISGIAALLKAAHPDWSPAAIKSAIVTTAMTTDRHGQPIFANGVPRKVADPFDYGGGVVDPNRAVDPGLVYDVQQKDYLKFFNCTLAPNRECDVLTAPLYYLNVPSIAIPDLRTTQNVWRTVFNVGNVDATYKAIVKPPSGIKMVVEPSVLVFDAKKKINSFKVTFIATRKVQGLYTFGSLTWVDGKGHSVRIPIAVRTVIYDNYSDAS
ncbi:subtilisin-like protease SBT3.9 [Dioscorea cayenensis subsp. rotundata]|uniref:Subtilisin-like protease SBT3.9 n=1 Tax=Dioscorea cayennensis subsp. rotundata TaxID=55577 RepID=A0AB40CEQ1_DIOCR|nr:subtilisin-like protease SBT3.9 [Dioscorea cayenensis subsp. rotundata]